VVKRGNSILKDFRAEIFVLMWCTLIPSTSLLSQIGVRENLQSFDNRYMHFGFLLSANSSSFFMDFNPEFNYKDSLLSIDNVPQAGFNLALMSSFNPIKNLNISHLRENYTCQRLIPNFKSILKIFDIK